MHEYTVAYDIYATAKRAALENSATHVNKIYVDIGELSMINPEQVVFLFGILRDEDSLFKDAVLECHTVKALVQCTCGYRGSEKFVCPNCGSLPEVIEGREILVTNLEIEVDDT